MLSPYGLSICFLFPLVVVMVGFIWLLMALVIASSAKRFGVSEFATGVDDDWTFVAAWICGWCSLFEKLSLTSTERQINKDTHAN